MAQWQKFVNLLPYLWQLRDGNVEHLEVLQLSTLSVESLQLRELLVEAVTVTSQQVHSQCCGRRSRSHVKIITVRIY